ncbi:hypothetical protein F4813DRAFT_384284 [Daldinia decipiens]|uniref:uncharacterized protein n=1 Tax=Daldinia decipiens TaxID=326647 RepID=UPI0020C5415A|nr:uncharacterized protein F4813DRAFT_384284 [Daldinia decipiens]KAI1662703.1 hypothetical protein F4813DRAFT_384284 [Daldinia decipiens]
MLEFLAEQRSCFDAVWFNFVRLGKGEENNSKVGDLLDLKLLVEYQTDAQLHVNIYDAGLDVYQIQEYILPRPSS